MRFLKKNFNILSSDEFVNILKSNSFKKKPSVLLTFDDGYKDHFKYVFPVLNKLKISGFFFPVTSTLKRNLLLNVNKIHLILEKVFDKKKLLNRIFEEIELKTGKKPWWKIWRKTLGTPDYYKLEKEVDANLQGLYLKAKKSRTPLKQVIDNYVKYTL